MGRLRSHLHACAAALLAARSSPPQGRHATAPNMRPAQPTNCHECAVLRPGPPCQPHLCGAVAGVKGADLGPRLPKHRIVGRNGQIAHHVQDVATSHRVAAAQKGLDQAMCVSYSAVHASCKLALVQTGSRHHVFASSCELAALGSSHAQLAAACCAISNRPSLCSSPCHHGDDWLGQPPNLIEQGAGRQQLHMAAECRMRTHGYSRCIGSCKPALPRRALHPVRCMCSSLPASAGPAR